jgi:DNA-binding MarR family transcriptional regulator
MGGPRLAKPRDEQLADTADRASSSTASAAELLRVVRAAERFVEAVEARSIALMLKLELSMPQLRALMTIRRLERVHGRQLAAALEVTPGAVVAICDHLEERGYVRRVPDTRDRRITWFEVTEQAVAGLKATPTGAVARRRTKSLIASLTTSEREGFIKIADAFVDAIGVAVAEPADARPEVSAS